MSWLCSIMFMSLLIAYVKATPPACFLSCIAEVAKTCPLQKVDITCLCAKEDSVLGCMVDICPYGTFFSGRDHFIGTCMEHSRPSISNPHPPDPIYPPKLSSSVSNKPTPISSFSPTISDRPTTSNGVPTSTSLSKPASPAITISSSITVSLSTRTTALHWTSLKTSTTSTSSSLTSRKFSMTTSTISSIKYKPSMSGTTTTQQQTETDNPENTDCDSDTESEDEYNSQEDCEWEETQSVDVDGNVIFIRRPINVPQKYRNPKNNGRTRKVIIKKPPSDYQWKVGKDKTVVRVVRKLKNTPVAAKPTKSKNIESNLYSHPSPTMKKSRYNRYPN